MSSPLQVMSSIVETDEEGSLVETDEEGSTMETDEEAEGRFPPQRQRELEMSVIKHGLPCRTHLEITQQRMQVILEPLDGWTHISTEECVHAAPYPYHISLCAPWDATTEEIAALRLEVDDKVVTLAVERITYGYCAVVENAFGPFFGMLHSRGWHSCISISM